MSDLEAIEVLTRAKERLFECGWGISSATVRDEQGDTTSLCLEDALYKRGYYVDCLSEGHPIRRAVRYLRATAGLAPGEKSIWAWNDWQAGSEGVVHDTIDAAVVIAKDAS